MYIDMYIHTFVEKGNIYIYIDGVSYFKKYLAVQSMFFSLPSNFANS